MIKQATERGYEYPISNVECPTPKESGGNQVIRVAGREYPISNKEYPTTKERGGNQGIRGLANERIG